MISNYLWLGIEACTTGLTVDMPPCEPIIVIYNISHLIWDTEPCVPWGQLSDTLIAYAFLLSQLVKLV